MKAKKLFVAALACIALAGCQNDKMEPNSPIASGDGVPVTFELDAKIFGQKASSVQRVYNPSYVKEGFSIYAFRKDVNGSDYLFERSIQIGDKFSYSTSTNKLTGTENLPIGTYKFVPAYGLSNQSQLITVPTFSQGTTTLTDAINISYNTTGALTSEVFLPIGDDAANLATWQLGTTGTNTKVTGTLKRAVGRVDVMFIAADKVGGQYIEKELPSGQNIFGNRTVESLQMSFRNINNTMNLFGVDATVSKTSLLNIPFTGLASKITIGDGTSTSVGETGYANFDNMSGSDIIRGSAHVFGPYLFPNANADKTVGMEMVIKLSGVESRIIPVTVNDDTRIPVEQNKVTLVKVYVLNGNDVGTTTVEFEFEVDVVWEDSNEVETEIS